MDNGYKPEGWEISSSKNARKDTSRGPFVGTKSKLENAEGSSNAKSKNRIDCITRRTVGVDRLELDYFVKTVLETRSLLLKLPWSKCDKA